MPREEKQRIAQVVVYIHTHLDEHGMSLASLAAHFGFSPSSLKRQFKAFTESSVGHYILEARMEKAKALLSSGDYTVAEVSQMIGFINLSHFSRIFTHYHGYSPSKIGGMS